jgi:hypothetical protein
MRSQWTVCTLCAYYLVINDSFRVSLLLSLSHVPLSTFTCLRDVLLLLLVMLLGSNKQEALSEHEKLSRVMLARCSADMWLWRPPLLESLQNAIVELRQACVWSANLLLHVATRANWQHQELCRRRLSQDVHECRGEIRLRKWQQYLHIRMRTEAP